MEEKASPNSKSVKKERVMQALHVPLWMDEMMKSGYQKFMDNMVHDALWNAKNLLIRYGKEHRAGNLTFEEVILITN
jgi:hypothetical protein